MVKISVGMETKVRPVENYFDTTMFNLNRAGVFESEHIADFSVAHGEGFTRQQNAQRAIAMAVQRAKETDANWVMKLEDDLDFTDNFLENVADWLEDFGHAKVPMFSLAASFEFVSDSHFQLGDTVFNDALAFPRVRARVARGDAIAPHPVRGYWGAQALVWRTADAEQLANWLGDDPALWDGKLHHKNRGHDLLLQVWGVERGAKHFGVAIPSFVQHIGRRSNLDQPEIGHVQPFFQFPFAGRDYRYQRRTINA